MTKSISQAIGKVKTVLAVKKPTGLLDFAFLLRLLDFRTFFRLLDFLDFLDCPDFYSTTHLRLNADG